MILAICHAGIPHAILACSHDAMLSKICHSEKPTDLFRCEAQHPHTTPNIIIFDPGGLVMTMGSILSKRINVKTLTNRVLSSKKRSLNHSTMIHLLRNSRAPHPLNIDKAVNIGNTNTDYIFILI
jgi:hypothetical protein